ncbi:MAG: hypothetical protein ACLFWI_28875 [Coleofasciculus sp.]
MTVLRDIPKQSAICSWVIPSRSLTSLRIGNSGLRSEFLSFTILLVK